MPNPLHSALLMDGNTVNAPIEIIYAGSFVHPVIGEFEITEDMIDAMIANFPGPARIPIDYNHSSLSADPNEAIAAGWIANLFKGTNAEPDRVSLMADVDWTDKAKGHIKDGEYRYVSAELVFNDVNNVTGEEIGPNLLAAAITNRPFVRQMLPLELSQKTDAAFSNVIPALFMASLASENTNDTESTANNTEDDMKTPKEIPMDNVLELLGVENEDGIEAAIATLKEKADQADTLSTSAEDLATEVATLTASLEEASAKIATLEEDAVKETEEVKAELSDKEKEALALSQRATAFETQNKELSARLEKLETEKRQRDGEALIASAVAAGKVAPSEVNADDKGTRPVMGNLAFENPKLFTDLVEARPAKFAQLQTEMSDEKTDPAPASTADAFYDAVNAKLTENPEMEQHQARKVVLAESPQFRSLFK